MLRVGKTYCRIIALVLAFALVVPVCANAASVEPVQPYASNYLDSFNTYICAMGNGDLQIWFTVIGDTDMDDIGTLSIMLYESTDNQNWSWKKTFLHEDYEQMLISGIINSDYVPYDGIAGRYYKAYVCIYAGIGNNGDSRYMWTSVERAT